MTAPTVREMCRSTRTPQPDTSPESIGLVEVEAAASSAEPTVMDRVTSGPTSGKATTEPSPVGRATHLVWVIILVVLVAIMTRQDRSI